MRIELDIYSGRPNPVWTVDDAVRAEFETALSNSRPASGGAPPPALGYRGLVVHRDRTLRIYLGRLYDEHGRALACLIGHGIERRLLESGRPSIDAATYRAAAEAIESART